MRFLENDVRKSLLLVVLLALGCVKDPEVCVSVADCVQSTIEREKYWESRILRWIHPSDVFTNAVDRVRLERILMNFTTNLHCCGAVPMLVKFSKDATLCESRKEGAVVDVRGNPDYSFEMRVLLFGGDDDLLSNRLYFCFPDSQLTVIWSRTLESIHSFAKFNPRLEKLHREGFGLYSMTWRGLSPVFLGDDSFCLDDFLKRAVSGTADLYWDCGVWNGIPEGKGVYRREIFERWIDAHDKRIPLEIVFSAHDTYIFAVGGKRMPAKRMPENVSKSTGADSGPPTNTAVDDITLD